MILICGIPATGKTTFGHWLQDHHGYLFVDMEALASDQNSLDAHGLRTSWERFWRGDDYQTFPASLRQYRSEVAIAWGFPVQMIHVISALITNGFAAWWFDGDRLAAREHFKRRDTRSIEFFDTQVAEISASWRAIEPVFAANILRVVRPDGTFEKSEKIYLTMLEQSWRQ